MVYMMAGDAFPPLANTDEKRLSDRCLLTSKRTEPLKTHYEYYTAQNLMTCQIAHRINNTLHKNQ